VGILLFLLALAQAVSVPAAGGSLVGSVTADGAPVRHARVVAVQSPGNLSISTATDAQGAFRFDALAPGLYSVRAEKSGFVRPTAPDAASIETRYAIQVRAASVITVPIHLARAAAIAGTIHIARESPADQSVMYLAVERLFVDRSGVPQTDIFTGKADNSGHFRIANLPEGRYRVRTILPNLSYWYAPGTPSADDAAIFTLTPGQTVDVGDLRWSGNSAGSPTPLPNPSPTRVIEGRILDEFGDPAPWIQVQLLHARVVAGHRFLEPLGSVGGSANFPIAQQTDDRGGFRFEDVPLGDVYLVALPEPFGRQPHFPDAEGPAGLQPSFYPGTSRAADARPIRINADTVVSDLTLTLNPAVTGALSIVSTDDQGQPVVRQVLGRFDGWGMLFQVQDGTLQPALSAPLSSIVRHLPVGDYVTWKDNELNAMAIAPGLSEIAIRDSPVAVTAPTSGILTFDGSAPRLERFRVEYQPVDPGLIFVRGSGASPPAAQVGPDRRFTFSLRPREPGVIRVVAPEGWALAKVTAAGREISDVGTDLAGLSDVTVEMTSHVGRVIGTVVDGGQPSAAHGVVLYAEASYLRRFPSRFVRVALVDGVGNFRISSVLPGRYLALALPDNTVTDVDLDWLDEMRAAATPVIVSDGTDARLVVQARR